MELKIKKYCRCNFIWDNIFFGIGVMHLDFMYLVDVDRICNGVGFETIN